MQASCPPATHRYNGLFCTYTFTGGHNRQLCHKTGIGPPGQKVARQAGA